MKKKSTQTTKMLNLWSLVLLALTNAGLVLGFQRRAFSPEDSEAALAWISRSQDLKTGFIGDSLDSTYVAANTLAKHGKRVPNSAKLCVTLKKQKANSWNEMFELVMTRSLLGDCLSEVRPTTIEKVKTGLVSNQLSQVFYSASLAHLFVDKKWTQWNQMELKYAAKNLLTFYNAKKNMFSEKHGRSPSAFRTAQGLSALSLLLKAEPSLVSELGALGKDGAVASVIRALLKGATEDDKYLSLQSSITVTALVLDAIRDIESVAPASLLQGVDSKPMLTRKQFGKLVRYVLEYDNVPDVKVKSFVVSSLTALQNIEEQSSPVTLSLSNTVLTAEQLTSSASPVYLRVTDVFSRKIANISAQIRVTVVDPSDDERSTTKKVQMHSTDGIVFTFDFVDFLKTQSGRSEEDGFVGVYTAKIAVSSDANIHEILKTRLKVTGEIKNAKLKAGVIRKNQDLKDSVRFPKTLTESYEASPTSKVKVELRFESNVTPSVVTFELLPVGTSKVERSGVSVPGKKRLGMYTITIDCNKSPYSGLKEGEYVLSAFVGDELLADAIFWKDAMRVEVIEEEEDLPKDYEPVNDEVPAFRPKQQLEHTFGPPPPSYFKPTTLLFTGLSVLPLLAFMLVISRLGLSFSMPTDIDGMGFCVSLLLSALVLFLYWYALNIFEAAFQLTIAVSLASIFGYRTLKKRLLLRLASKSTHKKLE